MNGALVVMIDPDLPTYRRNGIISAIATTLPGVQSVAVIESISAETLLAMLLKPVCGTTDADRATAGGPVRGGRGVKYRTICADPPWPIADPRSRPWCSKGGRRRRDTFLPYDLMTLDDIAALPIAEIAEADAHLFLWVTAHFNAEGYGVRVARAWGFERVAEIVWEKHNFGMGAFPRPTHEILMVCRRGTLPFAGPRNIRSVQKWAVPYENNGGKSHSRKPEAAMDLIEQVSPGPYVELFARRHRLQWDVWGNESANTATLEAPA